MSAGIAEAGMRWRQSEMPVPLPVQALDHATGYLLAATATQALNWRLANGHGTEARMSLARTAKLLTDAGDGHADNNLAPENSSDLAPGTELTEWGPAGRLSPPASIVGAPMHWASPAVGLRSSMPAWNGH
jgi:hypothetical protein